MIFDSSFWEAAEKRIEARRARYQTLVDAIRDGDASPFELDTAERIRTRLARLGFDRLARRAARKQLTVEDVERERHETDEIGRIALERILGRNDLTPISFLETGSSKAAVVGRVKIRNAAGRVIGYGTGFLVSPRLLLTNNHVLPSFEQARPSLVEFNYQEGRLGRMLPSVVFELDPSRFFVTSEPLDYSLVALREASRDGVPLERFGWVKLIAESGKALKGEFVNIVQHPNGQPKQLALRENQIVDVFDDFVHYLTDTAPGSSGSPVFNDQWEVLALHHAGVPRRDSRGRVLTRDGGLWRPGLEPGWVANEGIRISRIVADLKTRDLDGDSASMRRQLLELSPPVTQPEAGFRFAAGPGGETGGTTPAPRPGSDGTVEVTVPVTLRLAIQQTGPLPAPLPGPLPGPVVPAPAPAPSPAPSPSPEPAPDPSPTPLPAPPSPSRPVPADYYDADADGRDREGYYAGLDLTADKATLFELLSRKVIETHTTQLRYSEARLDHLYPNVDLHPDGLLRSVYSGNAFDPQEVIAQERALEAALEARIQALIQREGSLGAEALAAEIELLESSTPFNCEHVVPQSWFGKRDPMKSDLHHLFTCESGCNSFRSNIPYHDFPDFEEKVRDACGMREDAGFEPSASKGAVARATLYFLLRYPGRVSSGNARLTRTRIRTLLDWHERFPPEASAHEMHRNAEIFAVQGNRNPLVDHPALARGIDFGLGLG